MRRKRYSDEQIAFPAAGRGWHGGGRGLPQAWGRGGDVRPLASGRTVTGGRVSPSDEFAWMGAVEIRRLKRLEEGKHQAQAAGGRPQPGQDDAAGCARRRAARLGVRRDGVRVFRSTHQISERRARSAMGFFDRCNATGPGVTRRDEPQADPSALRRGGAIDPHEAAPAQAGVAHPAGPPEVGGATAT